MNYGGVDKREYAYGTYLLCRMPWSTYVGARALCPDGKVRNVKRISICADTFFSVPASVSYKGKTVTGYITVATKSGSSFATDDDPGYVKFIPYSKGKNGHIFEEVRDDSH